MRKPDKFNQDEEGNLLYLDFDGKIRSEAGEGFVQRNGEPVYLAPRTEKDRTNQGKGYTKNEFIKQFCQERNYQGEWYYQYNNKWKKVDGYFDNDENRLVWNFKLLMQPTRYSQHHIKGRVEETRPDRTGRY